MRLLRTLVLVSILSGCATQRRELAERDARENPCSHLEEGEACESWARATDRYHIEIVFGQERPEAVSRREFHKAAMRLCQASGFSSYEGEPSSGAKIRELPWRFGVGRLFGGGRGPESKYAGSYAIGDVGCVGPIQAKSTLRDAGAIP